MKEELYKYLSIGLLALLLLVCFGSLITYLVVGQESINTAYALDNTGYYENNLFSIPDASAWTFNVSSTGSEVVFYEDSDWIYSFTGYGSLINNVFSVNSGLLTVSFKRKNTVTLGTSSLALKFSSGSATCQFYSASANSFYNLSFNSTYSYYFYNNVNNNMSISGSYLRFLIPSDVTLSFISYTTRASFGGFVPNTYTNNGYNQGFTDGVNSVGGGSDLSGIVDLTDVSWRAPHSSNQTTLIDVFDVDGSFNSLYLNGSSFTFDKVSVDSDNSIFGYDDGGLITSPLYLINSSMSVGDGTIPVLENDLITFTGGDDATNSDLIAWLQANSSFLNYTDGYQDGYNQGQQIGYQNGYSDGQEQAQLSLSGIYNLVGSIKTLGNINSYSFNGSTYVSYSGETDSFTDSSSVTYYANYYDTQGDDGVLLGYCVNYLFRYSVKVRTIVYGTSARWNQVGFNIIAINTVDNTYFTLSRNDTSYYKEFGSLGADNSNGTYISCEFDFEFPSSDEYRLMFVPISHNVSEDTDNASMLVFEDTYFLAQGSGSMSYDDYNYLISDAYNRGMNTGRTNGYDSGREVGYNVGYSKGVEDAGNYTFNGLLGAVFDAPITMFIGKYNTETGLREGGLLNFNLLGVNLGGFVIALLSLGLILFILRLFIRGL